MSREKIKAPNRTERSPLIQKRRNRRGCSFVLFVTIALLLVPVIKSLPYMVAHFNATNCGSLSGYFPTGVVADKKEALQDAQCFFSAHQHCEAATLTVNYQYVDSGARVTFRTANSLGQCSLSIIGYPTACRVLFCNFMPYIDDDCNTLIQQEDGLHLTHCGSSPQDFSVPI